MSPLANTLVCAAALKPSEGIEEPTRTSALPGAAHERDRLATLFDVHHHRLFLLACRMTADREEARDLVQEVFVRAARHRSGVPTDPSHAAAWLARTMVNLCRDHFRRAGVRGRVGHALYTEARQAFAEAPSASNPETQAVAQATVRAALVRLSPRRRAVVVVHEIEEASIAQVAHLLGIAEVTVRWHLMAAHRQLRALLRQPAPPRFADAREDQP